MTTAHYQTLVTRRCGGVLHVDLNNPPVNLLDARMTRELNALAKQAATDPGLKVIVFGSTDPDFFISHSDETELLALPRSDSNTPAELGPFHRIMERIRNLPQITIGKTRGVARGGGLEFLLALDMRFAARHSRFGFPEVAVGLIPGGGGTQRLARLIGQSRAMSMIIGCMDVDAVTAAQWGLISQATHDEELDTCVDDLATRLDRFPATSLRAAKAAIAASTLSLEQGLLEEQRLFADLLSDDHTRARVDAFYRMGSQDREVQLERFDQLLLSLPTE
ncbi:MULTISPECIES: enoyl-CoA hydratase/isomerase family protein [Pseudomonas]|uniref:enoyl-CoA hydratase/isomerase family protein n=1 Tax=Pseudomonas TaxID=286 RepID=UPI00177D4891|nr:MULTISPECIES: enoyl-CoA hydratase/isomerase family protein [Pseudomonas]